MSNPKPTADDCRDRLVDRVLAEALGDERPPDLSPVIAQRVADAQAEVASTNQGRGAMRSRRVWITLLATAASLMVAAFVWQTNERREVMEVATAAVKRADEAEQRVSALEAKAVSQMEVIKSLAAEQRKFIGRNRMLAKDSGGATPQPLAAQKPVGELSDSSSTAKFERRLGAAGVFNRNPAVNGQPVPAISPELANKQFLERHARQQAADASRSSRDQGHWETFSSSVDRAAIPSLSSAPPATNQPYYATDDVQLYAQSPSSGHFGFAGGGDTSGRVYSEPESWMDLSRLRNRYKAVDRPSQDRYEPIHENAFVKPVGEDALSTFSVDVDTASYSNVRQYLLDMRQMPPADAVRIEELVNYFDYGYEAPKAESEEPFAANLGCFACPWKPAHKLVRIGVKGREVDAEKRPLSNLVFLVDVSGSMNEPNKLPLVIAGLNALADRLGENDRVAIVVYAGSEGVVLPSTSGDHRDEIRSALGRLQAGGSTAGGAGLRLAYELAERHKITGGVNRVVLCTDGDFNVGMTGTEELAKFVETRAKETGVYLTVLGFGRGNLNDAMLEQISGRGDGHYAYIDNEKEARRVLSHDLSGTLVTIAKDVKLQVEFNPAKVASYRLIGYENRVMAAEDFNNDAKDAGDIGAGHTVTALYEIVPVGVEEPAPAVDGLKYQQAATAGAGEPQASAPGGAAVEDDAAHVELTVDSELPTAFADELLTLKIRYKQPEGGASKKLEFPLEDGGGKSLADADSDFRWAAAVAEFGMLLRNSRHVGDGSLDAVLELARGAVGDDPHGYRAEFVDMVRRAKEVSGR